MGVEFVFETRLLPLWLLILTGSLFLLWLALRILEGLRRERLHEFADAALAPRLLVGNDAASRKPLAWLTLGGFFFLAVAYAQPRWGQAMVEVERKTRDVLVVLDVSPGMLADDVRPNRLERAKQKISLIAERMPGDRFGLIAFAGDADLLCPITNDRGYFRAVLRSVDAGTVSVPGTDIARALERAGETLAAANEGPVSHSSASRTILLVSDGEELTGDAVAAARRLEGAARIHAVGVGTAAGAEIEAPDWVNVPPGAPRSVTTRLDEDTLRGVAAVTGGSYTRGGQDTWNIEQIAEGLQAQAARTVAEESRPTQINRYQWPLLAAILCFVGEGVWLTLMPWLRGRREAQEAALPEGERDHA